MDGTDKNSNSTDGAPEAGGDSSLPTQPGQEADNNNPPQTPGDDTDGIKSFFGIKKPKESTTTWFEKGGDSTSQLAPSGALSVDHQNGKNEYEYNLSHAHRGIAHVFINKHFDERTEQTDRPGAEQDLILYSDSFKRLGFKVTAYFDKTKDEIINVFAQYAVASHVDEDAVIFAFSTHGEQDVLAKKKGMPTTLAADIIYAKDAYISVSTLTSFLTDKKCPTMENKPRLFFFQACRGQQLAETLLVSGSGVKVESEYKLMDPQTRPVEVPLQKDFFMAYSAPPGYFSFRRSKGSRCGSWFVLALNDIIKERDENNRDIDLMELVTSLNHRMTLDPEHEFISNMKSNPLFHKRMIVPWVASMLTKTVCFRNPRSKSS